MGLLSCFSRETTRRRAFRFLCYGLRKDCGEGLLEKEGLLEAFAVGRERLDRAFVRPWHVAGIVLTLFGIALFLSANPFDVIPFSRMESLAGFEEASSVFGIVALVLAIGSFYIYFNRSEELEIWSLEEREALSEDFQLVPWGARSDPGDGGVVPGELG